MKRYESVIQVKPEKLEEYKQLHAVAWPAVIKQINRSNIRKYFIYCKDGCLFSYFEYIGVDYEKYMEAMAQDEITQQVCKPCHSPLQTRKERDRWASMEEVFHTD